MVGLAKARKRRGNVQLSLIVSPDVDLRSSPPDMSSPDVVDVVERKTHADFAFPAGADA